MRTIIAGCRSFVDSDKFNEGMAKYGNEITIVFSGGATGADTLGELWAIARGIPVKKFPANWKAHGKAAGPIRNEQMAKEADKLIAFWDGESRGTKNMIELAQSYGLSITVIAIEEEDNESF